MPPLGRYTLQLGRILALPSSVIPYCTPWYRWPRFIHSPPALVLPLLRCVGFGGVKSVNPLPSTSCTPGISPAPAVAPCRSSPPPSFYRYSLCMTIPRPLSMGGTPSQWYPLRLLSVSPSRRVPSAFWTQSEATPGWLRPPSHTVAYPSWSTYYRIKYKIPGKLVFVQNMIIPIIQIEFWWLIC